MSEENKSPATPENPSENQPEIDTAAAMEYIEAGQAAAAIGAEFVASRKPKKPKKQKKAKPQPSPEQ